MSTWRLRDLANEAIRNTTSARFRTGLLALLTAGVIGALVFVELSTTGELLEFQRGFAESGGNVFIAASEEGLVAERCAAIASMTGVAGSVGVAPGPLVETSDAPGTLFNTGTMTAGALDVFTAESIASTADVSERWVVGSVAAAELGIEKGMWLGINGGEPLRVGAVLDTEQRNPRIDRWIMAIQAPTGRVAECWVEYLPGVTSGRSEALSALFGNSADTVVAPRIRLGEFSRNPVVEFEQRPQATAWLVAGLLIGMIGWLVTWFRRTQIGLYRAVGTSPAALLILGAGELGIPIVAGSFAGILWATATWTATATVPIDPEQMVVAIRTATSVTLIALATASLLWPLTARGSIADQLKGK